MDTRDLLKDAFGRIAELYTDVTDGLDGEMLHHRPDGAGNPMGWLLWHLARVQDDHVAELADRPQEWEKWRERFELPYEPDDTGFGHSEEQVAVLRVPDAGLLVGYHRDVQRMTMEYVERLDDEALDRIVDRRWDPPVTAGVRLVSVQGDCLQHLGQAAYVKGLLTR